MHYLCDERICNFKWRCKDSSTIISINGVNAIFRPDNVECGVPLCMRIQCKLIVLQSAKQVFAQSINTPSLDESLLRPPLTEASGVMQVMSNS